MKTIYGLLAVGACALAVGGCTTAQKTAVANALLTSGLYDGNDGTQTTVSDAVDDTKTTATITQDASDKFTVTVANGGAVAGPRSYTIQDNISGSAFGYGTPDVGGDSILVAGTLDGSTYAGFVAAFDDSGDGTGPGNIAAGFGGTKPTTLPTGMVTYGGPSHYASAVGVVQTAGLYPSTLTGGAQIDANFTNGTVNGQIGFDGGNAVDGPDIGDCCGIGFSGTMSGDHASYSSNSVAYNGRIGTGDVIGGFYGVNGQETAGAFNVQDTGAGGTGSKLTGSFVASSVLGGP